MSLHVTSIVKLRIILLGTFALPPTKRPLTQRHRNNTYRVIRTQRRQELLTNYTFSERDLWCLLFIVHVIAQERQRERFGVVPGPEESNWYAGFVRTPHAIEKKIPAREMAGGKQTIFAVDALQWKWNTNGRRRLPANRCLRIFAKGEQFMQNLSAETMTEYDDCGWSVELALALVCNVRAVSTTIYCIIHKFV